jgi:hypothetical protein
VDVVVSVVPNAPITRGCAFARTEKFFSHAQHVLKCGADSPRVSGSARKQIVEIELGLVGVLRTGAHTRTARLRRSGTELVWRSRAAGTKLDCIEVLNPTFNHQRAAEPRRPPYGGAAAAISSGPERPSVTSVTARKLAPSKFIALTTMRETGATRSTSRLVGRRDPGRASLASKMS